MIKTLGVLIKEHEKFSDETFGKDRNPIGPLKHLKKEIDEIIENPDDIVEYADFLLLFIDAIRLNGYTFSKVINAAFEKLEVNKTRDWPPLNKEGYSEHVK